MFQGSFFVIVIMTDGSEKRNCEGGFWILEFACYVKSAVTTKRHDEKNKTKNLPITIINSVDVWICAPIEEETH